MGGPSKEKEVDSQRKTWHAGKSFSSEMDPDVHLILTIITRVPHLLCLHHSLFIKDTQL